jgi:3-phosphoshikimate 1-carboxyvinyltransferase
VTALGVSLNPTRLGLLDALERMGARIERRMLPAAGEEPLGDVTVTGPERLRGVDLPPEWVPRMIDEIPAWAIAAACARGRSRVAGAAELRVKESDRLALIAANLGALGIEVREHPDGLEIEGGRIGAGTVRSDGDHRIAMAFLALGTRAAGPVTVDDAASIATSYPGFVEALAGLGGQVETGAPARPGASPGPVARSGRGGRAQAAASAGRARPKRTVGRAAQAAQRRRAS